MDRVKLLPIELATMVDTYINTLPRELRQLIYEYLTYTRLSYCNQELLKKTKFLRENMEKITEWRNCIDLMDDPNAFGKNTGKEVQNVLSRNERLLSRYMHYIMNDLDGWDLETGRQTQKFRESVRDNMIMTNEDNINFMHIYHSELRHPRNATKPNNWAIIIAG